jgi:hypothetical protein
MGDNRISMHSTIPADPVAAAALERVHKRIERMNRVTYLMGQMDNTEIEGLILLLERAHLSPARFSKLADITAEQADDALSMLNW